MAYASLHVLREWQKASFDYGYRPGWVTGDPNYFSLSALLGLPFAFYLMRTRQPTWERYYCIGCLGLSFLGFALAASRGGLLGLTASVMVVAWRSKHRFKVMSAAVVLLLPLMFFSPSSPLGRLFNPTYSDEDSSNSRLILWTAGLKMIRANPFFGVGVGNYKEWLDRVVEPGMSIRFAVAHNTYIQIGSELGLVGLSVFLGILFMTLRSTERIRRTARRARAPLVGQAAEAIQVGLVGFAVSITFVSAEYHKFFWLVVFITCCLPALMRPKRAGRPWWARGTPRRGSPGPVAAPPDGPAGESTPAPGPITSPSP
jgi:O-antigen ligase